ncbi:MAG: amidohydrolase family protein [Phycisphaeraceae bacterium]|nr:amidohydrolase family protein [Phycisphaeraceae bacterium]
MPFSFPGAALLAASVACLGLQPGTQLLPPANGPRQIQPGWTALVNATVHPRPGEAIEHATVVFRDGVITDVLRAGPDEAAPGAPAGAAARDATGTHIYAGLIDAFVEVDAPPPDPRSPGLHWSPRVTPQRSALDGAGLDAKTAKQLRDIGFTAAAISPKDGNIRGCGAVVSLAEPAADPSLARPPVYRDRVFQAVSFDTTRGSGERDVARWTGYPDSEMGAIALLRQTLIDADWFAAISPTDRTAAGDQAPSCLLAIAPGDAAPPLLFDVDNELQVLRAAKVASEFNRPLIIAGSGTEFRRLAAITEANPAIILPLLYPEAPKVSSIGAADEVSLRDLMTWEQAPTNPRRLAAAGLPIALTTSKVPDKRGGRGKFPENLRTAIRDGLTEDDALAMLTTTPARLLGVDSRMGTIEPGKAANLVVADGPLFDKKTKLHEVWIDGRRHEITPRPSPFEGSWAVILEPGPKTPGRIAWNIDKDGSLELVKSVDGEKDVKVKARDVKTDDDAGGEGRISFVFDHEPFGAPGVFTITGLLERQADSNPSIRGEGLRADGEPFTWSAVPQPAPAADASGNKPDADKTEDDDTPASTVPDALVLPFGACGLDQPSPQRMVLFTNATIWTSGSLGIIPNGAVLISGGKILYVGDDAGLQRFLSTVRLTSDPERIDLAGRHITPGIIDCHSHTGLSGGTNEAGQAVTAEVRVQDITNPDSINWYRQLAGGVTTVNNLHGSANPIGGQNCVNKIRWGVSSPDQMHFEGATPGIKFALGENVKQSNSDRATTRYPKSRMGVEAIIRDRFTVAREYARQAAAANGAAAFHRDLELEALAEILQGRRLVHCHSYRQDEILMLARLAAEFGFRLGTYQHNLEGYKVADAVRESAIGASLFADWWAYKVEVQDAIPAAGPIMHDAGVIVSYNSDSDELARRLNVEAAKAIKYGRLSPEQALAFITINPAKQLMIDDRVGSLEPGKDADLAIWSGNPLSSLSRCEATWVDGRELFSLSLDRRLRERDAAERQRLVQKALAQAPKKKKPAADKPDSKDKPDAAPADAPVPSDVAARSGRSPLLMEMLRRSQDQRRELYLDMLRRGIDPESARCGDCGELMTSEGALR